MGVPLPVSGSTLAQTYPHPALGPDFRGWRKGHEVQGGRETKKMDGDGVENKRVWTATVLGMKTTGLPPTSGPHTCTATTDRTSTEIRLNSSKQPQAPV